MMQFLGKEREVAESQHGFTATQEFWSIQGWEEIEDRCADYFVFRNPAMGFHPTIPVPDSQIFVQYHKPYVDRFQYLREVIHTVP